MGGENGTGRTTFIRLMAGLLPPDEDSEPVPELNVSYKPQKISPRFKGTVRQLLGKKIRAAVMNPQFNAEIIKPLMVEELMDQKVLTVWRRAPESGPHALPRCARRRVPHRRALGV